MNDDSASKRATALVHQALDLLQRAEQAPDSPVNAFAPAKTRRELRRSARRLRLGKARPRYANLHSAEELADVYERTVRRDETIEQALGDFQRITLDLGRVLEENPAEVRETVAALIDEAERAAAEHGPASEAAHRYRRLQFLAWLGQRSRSHERRQRSPAARHFPLARDPSVEVRISMSAVEALPSPPPDGEPAVAIPPDGSDADRGRMFLRIGTGAAAWTGSFARGHTGVSTAYMLPDGKHVFVCAEGAGYIIDVTSRTLVEMAGTDVVGIMRDEPMTILVVNHGGRSLEAFGRNGRLWKTDAISAGGFRELVLTGHELIGEARHASRPEWVRFSVELATGEVRV